MQVLIPGTADTADLGRHMGSARDVHVRDRRVHVVAARRFSRKVWRWLHLTSVAGVALAGIHGFQLGIGRDRRGCSRPGSWSPRPSSSTRSCCASIGAASRALRVDVAPRAIHSSLQVETQVVLSATWFDDRMAEPARPPIGDPLLERLERLAARQGRARSRPDPSRHLPPVPAEAAELRLRHGDGSRTAERRHAGRAPPARGARIGALVASCATTGGLAYFFAGTDTSQASRPIPGLVAPIATSGSRRRRPTAAPTATDRAARPLRSRVDDRGRRDDCCRQPIAVAAFDGDTVQTRYGPVQVQAQIQDGSLVAVAVVQYPDDDGKSVRINATRAARAAERGADGAERAGRHGLRRDLHERRLRRSRCSRRSTRPAPRAR